MARIRITPVVALVAFITLLGLFTTPFGRGLWGAQPASSVQPAARTVTHVVLFQWKADADQKVVDAATNRMMALSTTCLHPKNGRPYILSLKGGKDNSIEGLQNGVSHGFVVEFASLADRDYYVRTDPAHQVFIKSVHDIVEKATVMDFADGEF